MKVPEQSIEAGAERRARAAVVGEVRAQVAGPSRQEQEAQQELGLSGKQAESLEPAWSRSEGEDLETEGTARSERNAHEPGESDPEPEEVSPELAGNQQDTHAYLKALLEALLFVSDRPLSLKELGRAAKLDRRRVEELVSELRREYEGRGFRIDEVAEGLMFRTNPVYGEYVRSFLAQRPVRLSRAQVETLAVVAYRQPITRPEIDEIRGVDSGPVLKGLLERDLVRILGKKQEPGRPALYGTTKAFLELFGLKSLTELPTLRDFAELSDESRRKFEQELGEPAPGSSSEPGSELAGQTRTEAEGEVVEGAAPDLGAVHTEDFRPESEGSRLRAPLMEEDQVDPEQYEGPAEGWAEEELEPDQDWEEASPDESEPDEP